MKRWSSEKARPFSEMMCDVSTDWLQLNLTQSLSFSAVVVLLVQ